ncbi:MAG: hypothetical protein Q8J68_04310 [Methanolobus sp.]|uniref:hypothetical protein n=1 Tax=Methanolobus sp. TaxID=1874737 RepID=UPI0027301B1A|nr:hypothetical protein [Methanolobus sp.]MDP2216492.1 hypothetical protein [Methanolobus sp.]
MIKYATPAIGFVRFYYEIFPWGALHISYQEKDLNNNDSYLELYLKTDLLKANTTIKD